MKKGLLCFLLLIAAVAWWAVTRHESPRLQTTEEYAPAAYPADFDERLLRVGGMQLNRRAPLPAKLRWQTAETHPTLGHPDARKGGCARFCNAGPYPAHFLRFGGGPPQFFHQNLLAATELPLVLRHPVTGDVTAGVAEAWATTGKTVWFRLNPAARYTNGRPVRAADYLLAALLQAEQHCPEYEALASAAEKMEVHGEHLLSLTFRQESSILRAAQLLQPAEPGFYSGFGSDFRETYAQRIPPTTGAYHICKLEKGRLVVLQRIRNWWGEPLPVCRGRFNADTIEYHFLNSEAQVWEFLMRGRLDAVQTRNMAAWQQYYDSNPSLQHLEYDAEYPLPPYGIALNASTLPDLELRRGLLNAMDMDTAVQHMFRGEGRRLRTFHSGYGTLSPAHTPEYHYAPQQARAHFAAAGYTDAGTDGILKHEKTGVRLSVRLLYSPGDKINAMVQALVQSAAACGAEIQPEPVPWQVCQRQMQENRHQLVFWAVPVPEYPAPARLLSPESAESPFCLHADDMAEALRSFQSATSPESDLARIDQLVYEHAIWLPGWKENRVCIAHWPQLRIPPSPWCFDALDAHLFWIESEK
ncbi:MAG: hypothetical protein IKA23_07735 [Akkermansia sp.]|nr:hypothetical protein [Akkermansia sp.]